MWVERRHSIFGKIDMTKQKRDIDWTNSKSFGYVGAKRKQLKKRHITQKDEFIRLAKEEGFVDTITRQDIKMLVEKHELKMPYWLMKFENKDGDNPYKLGRGLYKLPSLDGRIEVADVLSQFDKATLKQILPEKEYQVVILRFGIDDGIPKTHRECGEIMGHSQGYAWRLTQKGLLRLEKHFGARIPINLTEISRKKYDDYT